jgi:hypothetical protein
MNDLAAQRWFYAEEIEAVANLRSRSSRSTLIGLRDEGVNRRLGAAPQRNPFPRFTKLRRDPRAQGASCWMHEAG